MLPKTDADVETEEDRERKCEKERLFSIFWKKIDLAVYTLSYRPFGYIFRSTMGEPGTLKTFIPDYQQNLIQNCKIHESKALENIGHAVRIPGIGTGHHGTILSGCAVSRVDDFAVREILCKHLERKLECLCQVLFDERELRMEALRRQFGVDFESGEVVLLDWSELQYRFHGQCVMEFGILGSDDGMVGFLGRKRIWGFSC